MPYPGNVHKYIMPVLLMSSCYKTSNIKHSVCALFREASEIIKAGFLISPDLQLQLLDRGEFFLGPFKVQELHLTIYHAICAMAEADNFGPMQE